MGIVLSKMEDMRLIDPDQDVDIEYEEIKLETKIALNRVTNLLKILNVIIFELEELQIDMQDSSVIVGSLLVSILEVENSGVADRIPEIIFPDIPELPDILDLDSEVENYNHINYFKQELKESLRIGKTYEKSDEIIKYAEVLLSFLEQNQMYNEVFKKFSVAKLDKVLSKITNGIEKSIEVTSRAAISNRGMRP